MKFKSLTQTQRIEIIFSNMRGAVINYLTQLNKADTPKKTPAQIRHEQQVTRKKLAERPAVKEQPIKLPKRY